MFTSGFSFNAAVSGPKSVCFDIADNEYSINTSSAKNLNLLSVSITLYPTHNTKAHNHQV
jgi:hypothetical protein